MAAGEDEAPVARELMVAVAMVFGGCMSAIISMEYVLKGDPKAGNLITLTEIVMVLIQSLPGRLWPAGHAPRRLKPLVAPLASHLHFAVLWVSMSVLANYAFAYKISVPIFTLIRSCNMIATVALGWLFFGQRYSWQQLGCIFAVSVGIFLASMGEAKTIKAASAAAGACTNCGLASPAVVEGEAGGAERDEFGTWLIGIAMLAFVQTLQGCLGHVQAGFYKRFGNLASKNDLCDEYLFTSHVVAVLPFFALREDIAAAARSALASDSVALPLPWQLPSRVIWLLINSASQSICLKGVFRTSSSVSALTLTIILSVRKFLSVLVSIFWFDNPWSPWHSAATVFIFGGAFAYSRAPESATTAAKKIA